MSVWRVINSGNETEKQENGKARKPEKSPVSLFASSPLRLLASLAPPTPHKGFTLLEVLVAMAVLAVALVSLLGLYNRSLTLTIRSQRLSTAMLLAQEMLTRSQLEGAAASRVTTGDFSDLHPGQYPEFRWQRTIRPTPLNDLWEIRVGVAWGNRVEESCELTLFTPLEGS